MYTNLQDFERKIKSTRILSQKQGEKGKGGLF